MSDRNLRRAVVRAAHHEEDVVADSRTAVEAIERGFPRLVIRDGSHDWPPVPHGVRVVRIGDSMLERWETERRSADLPPTRIDHLSQRITTTVEKTAGDRGWVDRSLAELARASGRRLPGPLRSFGRRILEFPSHYTSLHPLADACGTSRGALKARFRRRDLSSPSTYLRWFRLMAVAHVLSDREVTVAEAASRLGFTSDGNLCRMMANVADMTPTEVRSPKGWNRLTVTFAWSHLSHEQLEGWATFDVLFERRIA